MIQELNTSARAESINGKELCYVLLSKLENPNNLQGEICVIRKKYFLNGRKKQILKNKNTYLGYPASVSVSISSLGFKHKKIVNDNVIEEIVKNGKNYVLVRRGLNNNILGKVHYSRDLIWMKTEYYRSSTSKEPSYILKPSVWDDCIEYFEYSDISRNYISKKYYPVKYKHFSVDLSRSNEKFGNPEIYVEYPNESFIYCEKNQQQKRLDFLANKGDDLLDKESVLQETEDKLIVEIKEAEQVLETKEVEKVVEESTTEEFTKVTDVDKEVELMEELLEIEYIAKDEEIIQTQDDEACFVEVNDVDKAVEEMEEQIAIDAVFVQEGEPAIEEVDLTLAVENTKESEIVSVARKDMSNFGMYNAENYTYTGKIYQGVPEGRGRIETKDGSIVYEGEYLNGKRNGFGTQYKENGSIQYVGNWNVDRKNGTGISFKESDGSIHIANWTDGKPDENVNLFDKDGNLKFCGRIIKGKKQGVSIKKENGNLVIYKYINGKVEDTATILDEEGNVLYIGGFAKGKKQGKGTEFDKTGNIKYKGNFENDQYIDGVVYKQIYKD